MSGSADTLQSTALRRLFRTLFFRGRSGRAFRARTTPRHMGVVLWVSLLSYGVMGCAALAFSESSVLAFAMPLHGVTFFLLTMYVSASAGEVLFNKDEADILLHRPVLPRTILWAKIRVLIEITWWLGGAFNGVGIVLGCLKVTGGSWRFALAHVLSLSIEALLCVSGIVMMYELCLRFFGRERLDSLMTTAQVMLSMVGVAMWQLMRRAQLSHTADFDWHVWWAYFLPPYWFASLDATLADPTGVDTATLCTAAVGPLVTMAVMGLAFGKLAASYGEGLQVVGESHASQASVRGTRRRLDAFVHAPPMRWWLRDSQTRAAFTLTIAYLLRDREVKLRVYPQLASVVALSIATDVSVACCFLAMAPLNALESMRYSQQWQAADVFRCVPVAGPGPLCDGARRAVLTCLFAPAALVLCALTWWTGGTAKLTQVVACLAFVPLYARIPSLNGRAIPLARPNEDMRPRRSLMYIGVIFLSAVVVGIVTVVQMFGYMAWFIGFECVFLALGHTLARRRLASITWAAVEDET